jgi:M6 family metalloprotease-like protein
VRNKVLLLLITALTLALIQPIALAAVKPGTTCKTLGTTSTSSGIKYTCIKSGKKLVWNKGIAVKKATPSPTPTATPSPTPTATPSPTPTPTATPTPNPTPTIKTSGLAEYRSVTECKLINENQNEDVNQSHTPRKWYLVDTKKTIRILIFTVDFVDLVSNSQEAPNFNGLISDFEAFYKSQSNNSLKFSWTVAPKVTRMAKSVQSYGVGARASGDVWSLYNDIQDLALKTYKREDFDFLIGSAPSSTLREQIASSPAFGTREKNRIPGTYLGGDYWSNGASWTIPTHEFGHSGLGLADLYSFDASMLGAAGAAQQFKYMGVYDLMNWAGGAGLELTAWNRWIGGLIDDSQMLCLPDLTTVTLLKPLQLLNNEVKGMVIPISKSSAIVIENRAALGFDKALSEGSRGVIAYFVDTKIESGFGPMQVIRKPSSTDVWFTDNALKVGEVLNHKGYSIKVLGSLGNDMYVEVKKVG